MPYIFLQKIQEAGGRQASCHGVGGGGGKALPRAPRGWEVMGAAFLLLSGCELPQRPRRWSEPSHRMMPREGGRPDIKPPTLSSGLPLRRGCLKNSPSSPPAWPPHPALCINHFVHQGILAKHYPCVGGGGGIQSDPSRSSRAP